MREPEDHHYVLIAGIDDGVPETRWNVQGLTGAEWRWVSIGADLATAGQHEGDLFDLMRYHPGGGTRCED